MPAAPHRPNATAAIRMTGDVRATDFPAWILRHAAKLGLGNVTVTAMKGSLTVQATGPDEMLQALVLACSLGCASVLVEEAVLTIVTQ
jgi:acylphosphatase